MVLQLSWKLGADMNYNRKGHTVTNLPDGKILVVGGYDQNLNPIYECELYDVASNSWSIVGSIAIPRMFHLSVLSNGKVMIVGGAQPIISGNQVDPPYQSINSCELYDVVTQTWSTTSSMNHRRTQHALAILPSGKVLTVGGIGGNTQNDLSLNSIEIFDPNTSSWTLSSLTMSETKAEPNIILATNNIFILGGVINRVWGYDGDSISNVIEKFDYTANPNTISTMTTMPQKLVYSSISEYNGNIIISGGITENTIVTNQIYKYNVAGNSWTSIGQMLKSRYLHNYILFNNKLFLVGGITDNDKITDSCEFFDLITNQNESASNLQIPVYDKIMVLLTNDKVLLVGGYIDIFETIKKTQIYGEFKVLSFNINILNGLKFGTKNWVVNYFDFIKNLSNGYDKLSNINFVAVKRSLIEKSPDK